MSDSILPSTSSALDTYTNFSGLNALKAQASKDQSGALDKVAKQFESLFMSLMLKTMREANSTFSDGNLLNSSQTKFYQQMFDNQISVTLSQGKGMGLADVLKRQLSKNLPLNKDDTKVTKPVNPFMFKSIKDYPRTLTPQLSSKMLHKLTDTLKTIDGSIDTINKQSEEKTKNIVASNANELKKTSFASPEEFIQTLYPIAHQVEKETGINARLMLAQSALETGWGNHMIQNKDKTNSYNLFGIKADNRWGGRTTQVVTTEYRDGVPIKQKADFRSYASFKASFEDYASFLKQNPRYSQSLSLASNPEQLAQSLQQAGYATDPDYAAKITDILHRDYLADSSIKNLVGTELPVNTVVSEEGL
jgi:flagellar protein FlgJ